MAAAIATAAVAAELAAVRTGSFVGPSQAFGIPLQIVQSNEVPQFDPEIAALKGLSLDEKAKLQAEVEELAATLIVTRDTAGRK